MGTEKVQRERKRRKKRKITKRERERVDRKAKEYSIYILKIVFICKL